MTIVAYILFSMLVLRFIVMVINYLSQPFLPESRMLNDFPLVSILVPARNEEDNLPLLINDLKNITYPNFEIIVCNDNSTDQTENILKAEAAVFEQLLYFNNGVLATGWVGKNFACHQLAQNAKGEFLMFLDADVRIEPSLINKAMSFVKRKKVKLLSIFPKQLINSKDEWKTVPLMNWILLSYLPLPLVSWKCFSSLSAANGQFMFFEANNYLHNNWHEKVKTSNVDDILIARMMKKKGFKIAVLLGENDIACRMYKSYNSAIKGFALNIHQYFNGSRHWLLFFWMMLWFRIPFFVFSKQYLLLIISIVLIMLIKIMYSKLSRFSTSKIFLFHYQQLTALTQIIAVNLKNKQKRKFEWKGREYSQ